MAVVTAWRGREGRGHGMSLHDLVRQEAVARMTRGQRLDQLRALRLYFQRPEQPGFLVSETVEGPVVPVFTSWERLALFAGACAWASTTAEDLMELLPEGVRALVDPLGPRPFLLDAAMADVSGEDVEPAGGVKPAEDKEPAEDAEPVGGAEPADGVGPADSVGPEDAGASRGGA
ncbi:MULTISPECIES: SseB family protein [Streptomyces]|uniref:SseB family protein n=1 Tax=Streptomyces TaxID=1883 RepID=UPI0021C8F97B|nr:MULTISPECIES: SseB family protein [Streptomyces]